MKSTGLDMLAVNKPWLMLGDCLERMREITDDSVDMVLCDLPFGTTASAWDVIIPLEPLWEQYKRITRGKGAIVLHAAQPFSSLLVASNPKMFRYEWIWKKSRPTNFFKARFMPLREHENILVFSAGQTPYYPQGTVPISVKNGRAGKTGKGGYRARPSHREDYTATTGNFPRSIIVVGNVERPQHPTQKPVELAEYLIRTYTNEGEVVLDNCFGSGTSGVACANTGRRFIGIERDPNYFDIGRRRIEQAIITANQPAPFGGLFDAREAAE